MTGVNANGDVNVFNAKISDHAITLQSRSSVRVDGELVQVDPELLFQRLFVASNAIDDKKTSFRFELCSYPSALFGDSRMMRAPQKAVPSDAM